MTEGAAQHRAHQPDGVRLVALPSEIGDELLDVPDIELGQPVLPQCGDQVLSCEVGVIGRGGGLDGPREDVLEPVVEPLFDRLALVDERLPRVELVAAGTELTDDLLSRPRVDELALALAADPSEIDRTLPATVRTLADASFTVSSALRH
jgi:hypothetical protein